VIDGRVFALIVACLATPGWPRPATAQAPHARADADSAAIALVAERFHQAIVAGDSARAVALLDGEAIILESGDVETRSEYLSSHLAADIAFSRAVRSTRKAVKVTRRSDVAWVASTSRAAGTFEGRSVNSDGVELMVLTRSPEGWRIAAIHWSSHRHRP
jgi:hypothetical protein